MDIIEDRVDHALGPQLAVIGDGESMGFISHSLQEVERLSSLLDGDRLAGTWDVDLLEAFGETDRRDVELEFLEHRNGPPKLARSSVDDDQRGWVGELSPLLDRQVSLCEVGSEAAPQHLLHRSEVVLATDLTDLEAPIVGLSREPILEDHHRRHGVCPLDG